MYSSIFDGGVSGAADLTGASGGYRREFEEMECRIRKCERQRAELERQFADLMRERTESERAAARAAKQRHKRQLEAERHRAERNESILRMLNKIDQQAASLAAKTDRLKMLKTQYEMYLMRTYSSAQSLYSTYNPPMIAAPPTMVLPPKAPASPSKSGFAQYLSDLTLQQQQASGELIPPPTALSNYLAARTEPKPERPYSRMFQDRSAAWETDATGRRPTTAGSDAGSMAPPMVNGGAKAKRFEMSNEDFIRYIDSEVLKEPIPTVSVLAPTPEAGAKVDEVPRAYLEDAGLSEDEQRPASVDRLVEEVDQFRIVAKEENVAVDVEGREVSDEATAGRQIVTRGDTSSKALDLEAEKIEEPFMEELPYNGPEHPLEESAVTSELEQSIQPADAVQYKEQIGHKTDDIVQPHAQETYEVPQEPATEQWPSEEGNLDRFKEYEHVAEYSPEQTDPLYPQETAYNGRDDQMASQSAYTEQFYQTPTGLNSNETIPSVQEALPADVSQVMGPQSEHSPQKQELNVEAQQERRQEQEPGPQTVQQPTVGSQRWSTARQAMRSKAFPEAIPSKVPSPEMKPPVVGVPEESYQPNYDTTPKGDGQSAVTDGQENYGAVDAAGTVENSEQNATVYPEYGTDTNEPNYYAPAAEASPEPQQISSADAYQNDGMGQPVDYQSAPLEQAAMYQYQQGQDGQHGTYHEGQYVEGGSGEQYQYAEGAEQAVNPYETQEGYHDPNPQYQYDPNAQYYDQQQQGYEGQYYGEDPQQHQEHPQDQQHQQQQQQYYTDDHNQQPQQQEQQQLEGHYEQQGSSQLGGQQQGPSEDQYQQGESHDSQAYQGYPADAQYESPTPINPAPAEGTEPMASTSEPPSEPPKPIAPLSTPQALPSVEAPTAASDASPPKATSAKKGSSGKTKPVPKKDAEPVSDTPTSASTINDESDFDFSTQ